MKILILCPNSYVFEPLAKACYYSLLDLGHDVACAREFVDGYDMTFFMSFYHKWDVPKSTQTIKVGWHMEPLPWGTKKDQKSTHLRKWFYQFQKNGLLYDKVIDISQNNTNWLRSQGYKNVHWCAPGYHSIFEMPILSRSGCNEIIFWGNVGGTKNRRNRIINFINKSLKNNKIEILNSVFNDEDLCVGLSKAQISINIHNRSQKNCEFLRIIHLMSNRRFILTEEINDNCPWIPAKHWAVSSWQDMPQAIEYYMNNPGICKEIGQQGYDFIKENFRFITHLEKVLCEIVKGY